MQLINQPHQDKIGLFHGCRLSIHGSARHQQQFALPFDGNILMFGGNLLDTLRSVYFLSTSDKKSRSATNCPIV